MPSSIVRTFADPDDYAATIRAATVKLTVTGRGDFNAKLTRVDLHCLWMQRFSDNLPRIVDAANIISGRSYISFRIQSGPTLLQGGVEMHPSSIVRYGAAHDYYQLSSGLACFGTMSLPVEDIASVGEAIAGLDLTPPGDQVLITPSPVAMARLQRLHAAAGHLAENAPEIIANPDAARGLEQALIESMVDCLAPSEAREDTVAYRQHELIMRRFRRVIEESPDQPLYVPEISKAIRVSSRTLRACCLEYLGMGPKHYLLLRRLHLARRALREAEADTSVTEIATQYGFWQLGRFAVEYQSLFGESPSATLRRKFT